MILTVMFGVTLIFSGTGFYLGSKIGSKYDSLANILGGIILIAVGSKTLLEHLLEH